MTNSRPLTTSQRWTASRHWTTYVFYAFLAVLVWAPMPLASRPQWATAFFNVLVACLSMAVMVGVWRTGHALPPAFRLARWPLLVWLAYLGWLLFQNWAGYSINTYRSYQQILLTLSYLQVFMLTLFLVDSRERVRLLFYTLTACGVFQALYGGVMALSGVEKIWWLEKEHHRGLATGTFRNRNQLANYLVICLSAGCGLLVAAPRGQAINTWRQMMRRLLDWLLSGSGWLRLLLASIVIGVVLTHSRMGNVSLFVSLTLVGLIWLARNRRSWKHSLVLIGSLLLVDTWIVGSWFGIDNVVDRIKESQVEHSSSWVQEQFGLGEDSELQQAPAAVDKPGVAQELPAAEATTPASATTPATTATSAPSATSVHVTTATPTATTPAPGIPVTSANKDANELRDEAFPQLVKMARAYATRGLGLGNFSTGFFEYNQLDIRLTYNEAHCDYLQFLIEVGVPGFLLLGVMVLFCIMCGLVTLWSSHSRLLQGVGFAVCMTAVASLLHAWVEFNFQSVAPAVLFVVMMAMGVLSRSLPDKVPQDHVPQDQMLQDQYGDDKGRNGKGRNGNDSTGNDTRRPHRPRGDLS